jgi:hypothetical protein
MNAPSPVPLPAQHRTWPARLIQLGAVLVVTAIAAATFVLPFGTWSESDSDPADKEPGDPASLPDEDPAGIPVPEVPGIPYATGPRLRRVRSLPAPPVDDGGDDGE